MTIRERFLQVSFPVALGRALALTFPGTVSAIGSGDGFLASWLPPFVVIVACMLVFIPVYRVRPTLLRVPASITWLRLVIRLIVCAVITLPSLMVLAAGVAMMLDSPRPDPNNPQDIPLWVFAATYYPDAWAPVATLALTGWTLREKTGR